MYNNVYDITKKFYLPSSLCLLLRLFSNVFPGTTAQNHIMGDTAVFPNHCLLLLLINPIK